MSATRGVVTYKATGLTALMTSIETAEYEKSGETVKLPDENGNVLEKHRYREMKKITATGEMDSTAEEPALGDTLEIDSVTYDIESVKITENREDFKKMTLELEYDKPSA